MTSPTNLQFDACLYWCVWIFFFWILHLSFVAFANTFTGTFVAFANIFTINICGFSDQFRSDGSSTPGVIPDQSIFGLWDLDCLVNRMEHMQVANGCWRTRWGSCAVLACMSVSNQLIILHQLSNVAHLGSSSHFEIAALFGRQRCGSIYFDLCFCLGCIDITNNWFECSANHFRTTQIHPHIKADHQTYPSLLHSHSTTHRCEKCELKATTPNTNKKHDRSLPVGSMAWPNLSIWRFSRFDSTKSNSHDSISKCDSFLLSHHFTKKKRKKKIRIRIEWELNDASKVINHYLIDEKYWSNSWYSQGRMLKWPLVWKWPAGLSWLGLELLAFSEFGDCNVASVETHLSVHILSKGDSSTFCMLHIERLNALVLGPSFFSWNLNTLSI